MLKGPYHLILLFWISASVLSQDVSTTASDPTTAFVPTTVATTVVTTTETTTTESPTTTEKPTTTVPTTTIKPKAVGIYLPIFTVSDEAFRPKAIGSVSTSFGNEVKEHALGCVEKDENNGKDKEVEWLWKKDQGDDSMAPKLSCDFGPTIMGTRIGAIPDGTNCKHPVGSECEKEEEEECTGDAKELETIHGPKASISVIDPFCSLEWANYTIRHRWGNYDKTTRNLATLHPKSFPEPPGDLYMRQPVKDDETAAAVVAVSKRFLGHLFYGPSGNSGPLSSGAKQKPNDYECKDGCKYGQHIIVNYEKMSTDIHVYVTPFCDWFTVCTKWEGTPDGRCHVNSQVNVMLRNGFVSFDSRREQSTMRLHRYYPNQYKSAGEDDKKNFVTRVDLSILSAEQMGKDNKFAYMAVTSAWRERTVGRINVGNEMMISFSHPDCLKNNVGLRAHTNNVKVPFYKFQASTTDYEKNITDANKENVGVSGTLTMEEANGVEVIEVTLATTIKEIEEVAAETTTVAPHAAEFVMPEVVAVASVDDEKPKKEGHAIWGIFYGWLIGSAAAIAIMAPIMFFMRRTMYGNWYRGMYKRYGCDASGSTGGITGAGFDETGTGMQTLADGMTTGGGGGTIGGATTGAGTTGTGSQSQISQISQQSGNTANTSGTSMITI